MLTNAEYIEKKGLFCPECEEETVEGTNIDMSDVGLWQNCKCVSCGAEWTDVYKLVGYDHLSVPTPPEVSHA